MSQTEKSFKYFVARKNSFLVVSLVGAIADNFLTDLEQCKTDVLGHNDVRALVLNFAEVSEVGNDAIPILAQLQAAMRQRGVQLRLSAVQADVLDKMMRKGVVRKPELAADLKEALQHLARAAA